MINSLTLVSEVASETTGYAAEEGEDNEVDTTKEESYEGLRERREEREERERRDEREGGWRKGRGKGYEGRKEMEKEE